MVKLQFTNAEASDTGYGLEVNGQSLEEMISVALGTRIGNKAGYNSGLPDFKSNCCNITVIIDPQPTEAVFELDGKKFNSVQDIVEAKGNGNSEEVKEADPEE